MRSSLAVAAFLAGLAGVGLGAGCGKKAGDGAPDCGQLGTNLVGAMKKTMAESATIPAEVKKGVDTLAVAIKDRLVARCSKDKWPAEVRSCMNDASGDDERMRACSARMPKELRDKFEIDIGGKRPVPADQAATPAMPAPPAETTTPAMPAPPAEMTTPAAPAATPAPAAPATTP